MTYLLLKKKTDNSLKNISITFVGDGNNVATSLAKAILTFGGTFIHSCPKGYEIPKEDLKVIEDLQRKYNGNFLIENNLNLSVKNSDIVYTDVWASMGQESQQSKRIEDFKNYQVNEKIIETNNAIFMHDLPAHHGEEISENLVDHKNSVVFDQAENRIWGQLGIIKKIV